MKRLKIRSSLSLFCCCRLGFHLHSYSQHSILFIPDLQKPPCCTFLYLTKIFQQGKTHVKPSRNNLTTYVISQKNYGLFSSLVWVICCHPSFSTSLIAKETEVQMCRMQDPLPSKKGRELYFSIHYVLHINKSTYMHLETPVESFEYILFLSCIIRDGPWEVTNCDYQDQVHKE